MPRVPLSALEEQRLGSWSNKFEHPTKKDLLAQLNAEHAALFEKSYKSITSTIGSKPKLVWLDLPWRWSFEYTCPEHALVEHAYLIPDPELPRIAATVRSAFFEKHAPDAFPKVLRPGIASGVLINHQTWCHWELADSEVLHEFERFLASALEG
jgi:hypothetical protein